MKDKELLGAQSATAGEAGGSIAPESATARHTPGLWRVSDGLGSGYLEVVMDDSEPGVCVVADIEAQETEDEEYANAYLIAAAPEMKEALIAVEHVLRQPSDPDAEIKVLEVVRAALAKAEGRQ